MITLGQIQTARMIVRSALKQALELENTLDAVIEEQKGDLGLINNALDALAAMAAGAKGALEDQTPSKPVAPKVTEDSLPVLAEPTPA